MENEGLWSKLQNTPTYEYKPFTIEEFKKVINQLFNQDRKEKRDDRIHLPAQYLLACSDEDFIAMYNRGDYYKIEPCGKETYDKIQERIKKLIK